MDTFIITATQKQFKNGQNGYEVKVNGMDEKVNCRMNFHNPLKAMRYMFLLSKRLNIKIDKVQLTALVLAHKEAKALAEQTAPEVENPTQEPPTTEEPAETPATEEQAKPKKRARRSKMQKQFDDLKAKHPDALLLFRCGDFYETCHTDAEDAAKILGITLTVRNDDKTKMAGFPYHALDTYLPKLIRAGKRVAICDQIEEPKKAPKREITELVTPGTGAE